MDEVLSIANVAGLDQGVPTGGLSIAPAELAARARELAWIGQHDQAIKLASQALEQLSNGANNDTAQVCLDLLDTRAESYAALGSLNLAAQDSAAMVNLSRTQKRPEFKTQAMIRKAFMQLRLGDPEGALQTATTAAKIKHTSPTLRAASLLRLGEVQFRTGRHEAAIQTADKAIPLFQTAGDSSGGGRAHWVKSVAYFHLGRVDESRRAAQTAVELCQKTGDWHGVGNALIELSHADEDFTDRIKRLHQALQAFESAGYTERRIVALVELGRIYLELGLSPRASRLLREAVETSRAIGANASLANGLMYLVGAELNTDAPDLVPSLLVELTAITPDLNDPAYKATLAMLLGDLSLAEGNSVSAIQHYRSAAQVAHQAGLENEIISLTKLGRAYLANGSDPIAALQATTEATDRHRDQAFAKPDGFTRQEIWWYHAQALKANRKTRESHEALERAYHLLLESINHLRDAGLHRNYLNKVRGNREIITAWIDHGMKRKLPKMQLLAHLATETNPWEPFKRLVDSGLRLNSLPTVAEIQTYLVEEATELSGGERVLLILEKEDRLVVAESVLPGGEDAQAILRSIGPHLARARLSRTAQLSSCLPPPHIKKNDNGYRDCIVAPLITQNALLGFLYIDIDAVYGHFTEVDRDMVGVLANQAAVAIDNAQRAHSLAQKVQERTGQLHERVDELQVINAIQQGFTAELDFQAVVDLIGNKLRQVFNTPDIGIRWYDEKTNLVHYLYEYEHGERIEIPPRSPNPGGIWETINRTHQPVIFNTPNDYRDTLPIPGTDQSKSLISVPIVSSDRILGSILLENYERENAYGESEVRLLTTVAASLGTVLENARLFDEAQSLLKETKQRATELEIINSISQALTQELELQTLMDLVGDKLRETFGAPNIGIGFYIPERNELHVQYAYKDNVRIYPGPIQLSEFTVQGAKLGRSLVINRNAERIWPHLGSNLTVEGLIPKSVVIVPILAAKQLIGGISVQDFEKEQAYSESFVRLLETIASNMGTAIRNAQLFDETQRLLKETEQRAAELSAINTVSQALVAESELENLIQLVGNQMQEIFNADIVYIALADPQTGMINFPYSYGDDSIKSMKIGEGLTSKIIQTGKPLLINRNVAERSAQLGTTRIGKGALSYLGVPISVDGKPIGVVSVQSTSREGVFTDGSLRLLSTIAANAGTAIHSAQLHTEAMRRARETAALLDISRDISSSLDAPTVLEGIATYAKNLLNGDLSAVFLPEEGGTTFRAIAAVGDEEEELRNDTIRLGEGILGHIAQTKAGEIFNNVDQDPRAVEIFGTNMMTNEHMLAVPLMAGNDLQGLMAVWRTGPGLDFSEHELDFLNGLARQAVIAIQNAQLFAEAQETRAIAEQANKAKSTFLANMSHELRTPLNAIMGFTRIVRRKAEGILPDKQIENLDKVLSSSEHLLGLINTVLDIAKIEAGRMDVFPTSFSIQELADQCAVLAIPLLKPSVTFEKQVDERIGRVYSDQDKIKQIILNLLSNAAKFTHEGKIILSIRQDERNQLYISVADNGIGISAEALSRIFDEFTQADASTTRQYGGTGLGLTISRNLARLLGGDLVATSQPGVGSTFTLSIPIKITGKSGRSTGSLNYPSSQRIPPTS